MPKTNSTNKKRGSLREYTYEEYVQAFNPKWAEKKTGIDVSFFARLEARLNRLMNTVRRPC